MPVLRLFPVLPADGPAPTDPDQLVRRPVDDVLTVPSPANGYRVCLSLSRSLSLCLSLSLSVSLCLSVSPSLSAPLSLCLSVSLCNRLNSRSSYGKTKGFLPNVNNRQAVQQLCATNPLAARLNNAHLNCMEGYAFFAAGVLACVQAGVDKGLVENCCVFFLAMRTAYIIAYIIAVNNLIANFRTATWFASVIIQAKLFFIAAAAASQ